MKKWLWIGLALFASQHIIRDYLQERGVENWFTTAGHIWNAPEYNVVGIFILIGVVLLADYEALSYAVSPRIWQKRNLRRVSDLPQMLPKQSYAEDGRPMEPVNLVLIGSKEDIRRAFQRRGWKIAERLSLRSALRAVWALIGNRSYPRGPFGWGYVEGRRQDLGLERETEIHSFRQRHHIRLWRTPLRLQVATASFDVSASWSSSLGVPVHHIDPKLSREGSYIRHQLGVPSRYLQLGRRQKIHNADGDPMSWDGRALLLNLSHYSGGGVLERR